MCLIKHLLDVVRLLLDMLVVCVLLIGVHSLLLQALVHCFQVDLLRGFVSKWVPAIVLPIVERLVGRMLVIEDLIKQPLMVVAHCQTSDCLTSYKKLFIVILRLTIKFSPFKVIHADWVH